jgi:hypothetical protein
MLKKPKKFSAQQTHLPPYRSSTSSLRRRARLLAFNKQSAQCFCPFRTGFPSRTHTPCERYIANRCLSTFHLCRLETTPVLCVGAGNRTLVRKPSSQMSTRVVGEHRRHCLARLPHNFTAGDHRSRCSRRTRDETISASSSTSQDSVARFLTDPIHYATARSGSADVLSFAFDLCRLGFTRSANTVPRRAT